jgi:MFS family permease
MASPRPGLWRAIAALESRDFRYLFAASLVAAFGGVLQQTANLWQIYELTGSAVLLGLTGVARAIPTIGLSLIGGVIADRLNRRAIIMAAQAVNGVVAVGLGLLTWAGVIDVWHIYLGTLITSSFGALSQPARSAIIPNLVPRHQLTNAIALGFSVYQIARIVAPAVAGIGIASVGLPLTYGLTGLAFVATFVMLSFIFLGPAPARPRESFLRSMGEGLGFVARRRPVILTLLATDAAAMLFGSYQVLMPVLADRLGASPTEYGLLWSADAVGAVVGAVFIGALGEFRHKGYVVVGSILAYCAALAGLALAPWFLLAALACAVLGVTDSMQATTRNGVIQLVTPDQLRGRVSSFQHLMVLGMPSIGYGLMGVAASVVGPPLALIAGATTCALINLGIIGTRTELRERDLAAVREPAGSKLDFPELSPTTALAAAPRTSTPGPRPLQ